MIASILGAWRLHSCRPVRWWVKACLLVIGSTLTISSPARAQPVSSFDLAVPKSVNISVLVIDQGSEAGKQLDTLPFDVAPDGLPLVADGSALRIMGTAKKSVSVEGGPISDLASLPDGTLALITQKGAAMLTNKGLKLMVPLAEAGMHIRGAGEDIAYVFGAGKQPGTWSIFLLNRNGSFSRYAELQVPVTDVTGDGSTTYVASGRTILRIESGVPAKAILNTSEDIASVAWVSGGGLFYTTSSTVGYLTGNGTAYDFMLAGNARVRIRGDSLFLLIPTSPESDEPKLVRFTPASGFEEFVNFQSR
jgi:hypothetical protein